MWIVLAALFALSLSILTIWLLHRHRWRPRLVAGSAGVITAVGRVTALRDASFTDVASAELVDLEGARIHLETPAGKLQVETKSATFELDWRPRKKTVVAIGEKLLVRGLLLETDGTCDAAQVRLAGWPRPGLIAICLVVIIVLATLAATIHLTRKDTCPPDTEPHVAKHPTWVERSCRKTDSTRHGPARIENHVGRVIEAGHYRDGHKHGVWRRFHRNGKLAEQISFSRGRKHGRWERFHRSGALAGRGDLEAASGPWVEYHENGKIARRGHYKDGLKHGHWTLFSKNGKKAAVGSYHRDKRHGQWRGFDKETTKLAWQRHYRQGALHGPYKRFGRTGLLELSGSYRGGKKHGRWRWYHPNSEQLARTGDFKDGQKDGPWRFYDEQARLKLDARYEKGKRSGVWRYFCAVCKDCDVCASKETTVVEKDYTVNVAP
jgi:antitoxin component YwqK of YwqJK toxin-antitoxin module